ncbi:hypothetical protein H5154_06115 [Pseudoalteromonas sp. SR44-5]|uniref:esterase/lipase family protein n=1 Tax=Pseudoalteromonas sp. SR44-5 TaxID=2760934 RepID=UPI00160023F0|nr:hypothetical protein [Pseudoalteromonas sp. SR44-5]MBB1365968.1 hypothetical protein [Pseudoalteromonas sp. SR44-5]
MSKFIVFVHGLGGEIDKTWGNFPQFIIDDPDIEHTVIEYGYTSPHLIAQFLTSGPTILNIANGLLTDLEARCDLANDEIILVGHSMGGLVIKRLLVRLSQLETKHNIKKVCFFDVPHGGSGLANIGQFIAFRNRHLKSLTNNSSDIDALDEAWTDKKLSDQLNILSIIDANETVVSSVSSKSLFRYHPIKTINRVNHSSIVKPNSESDTVVLLLKMFIKSSPSVGNFNLDGAKPIKEWLKYDERKHELAYEEDDARKNALKGLSEALNSNSSSIRLTGLSGLGKSRLLIEYKSRNNLKDSDFIIFSGSENEYTVKESIKTAAENGALGFVIIDNCNVELHNYATNAIEVNDSPLKLITTYFYHEEEKKLTNSIRIKLEKLESAQISNIIDSRLPELDQSSKQQLEKFIEGFPLLAQMTIKELQQEGRITTSFSESDLVEKLINGDGSLSDKARELLKVFSLFDYFRFQKGIREDVNEDAEFLNSIAGTDQITFENTIMIFKEKELINCTGSLARIVPKPLALNLAMEWWNTSTFDRQSEIVSKLPARLQESFCNQIKYLDSSINVQSFVENFCAANHPFGQAELLLSKQGSRLFRALVEVSPTVTNNQLYRVISQLTDEEIQKIAGEVRRNLVWALEMLAFHKSCFEKASWCLFKLAQFENESFSNNALGQFSQLFRWQLSGTEADFSERLAILERALTLNIESADVVIIEAVKTAINTHGGTRTIGAEFQGTKAELTEWSPKKYQEIYDYWQSLLNILLEIIKRDRLVAEVKEAFGNQIRGLMRYEIPEQLNSLIKEIIMLTGKYWPAASQSIVHALQYDSEGMGQEQRDLLRSWEKLLSPTEDSIEEKLKLIVLNPSREHVIDNDGHYIDIAAENAKKLSLELKNSHSELVKYFELLMTFPEQKQSWVFAKYLVLESDSYGLLLNELFDYFRTNMNVSTQFFAGFLSGLYVKNSNEWLQVIGLIEADEHLIQYYPSSLCTGKIESSHLNTLIGLIKNNQLPSHSASILAHGSVTEHLKEHEIAQFCMTLSEIDPTGAWVALDNINMYTHGRSDIDFKKLTPALIHLVLNVSFKQEDKTRHFDSFYWLNSVKKLLKSENEEFALQLCLHLVEQVGNHDIDYSDLWDYLGEGFYKAFKLHGNYIWPKIADKFIDGSAIKQYRLVDLLGSGKSYKKRDKSIFDILEPEVIIDWCQNESALIVVGRAISMFTSNNDKRVINPLIVQLLSEYSDNKAFLSEISANFLSRSWVGSLVPYLKADKEVIQPLMYHESIKVKNWASDFVEHIDHQIEYETKKELERKIREF